MKDFFNYFIFDFIKFGRKTYPYLFISCIICIIYDYWKMFNNTSDKFSIISALLLSTYFVGLYIAYLYKRYNDLKQ